MDSHSSSPSPASSSSPGIKIDLSDSEQTTAAAPAPALPSPSKPKSNRQQRPRSPSVSPPPPPPPPLATIRLDIPLGGPENYEVDIASIARATGQRPSSPPRPLKRVSSDSEGEDEPKPKKKKKNEEYYDTNDPFIDDSELALDQRQYFAQTKQQGFYVSSGEVALMKDKSPKKTKPRKGEGAGARDASDALMSEAEDGKPGHRPRKYITVIEGGKKKKIVDITSFHPELQAEFDELKLAIAKEDWSVKGKFPPSLKPLLARVTLKAVTLDEYDEHYFNLMPVLFPYNKFTMTKLIKRTIFTEHHQILVQRQDALLEELATLAQEGFERAIEEWEKSLHAWEKRMVEKVEKEKAKAEESDTHAHAHAKEDAGSGMDVDQAPAGKEQHPPQRKYRLTERMKAILWNLVSLSNECCRMENEKNSLEGSTVLVSEQGLRKVLYQKIVAAFPEGWMSTGQISREVSTMKKKFEKEAMENEM